MVYHDYVGLFSPCMPQFVFCPACHSKGTSTFQNFPQSCPHRFCTAPPWQKEDYSEIQTGKTTDIFRDTDFAEQTVFVILLFPPVTVNMYLYSDSTGLASVSSGRLLSVSRRLRRSARRIVWSSWQRKE